MMRKMMMGTLVMVIEMMTMISMVVVMMVVVRQFLVAKLGGCQKSLVRNSTWVA